MKGALVVVFTKVPTPGAVKTRLAADLGPERACDLYKLLGSRLLDRLKGMEELAVRVAVTPEGEPDLVRRWLGEDLDLVLQRGADLGERMHNAVSDACREGYSPVILVGCDGPGIDEDTLRLALDALSRVELAVVPAHDGGYLLIGMHAPHREIFSGILYGGDRVFRDTMTRARETGLSVELLPAQHDLDRVEDLRHFPELRRWVEG